MLRCTEVNVHFRLLFSCFSCCCFILFVFFVVSLVYFLFGINFTLNQIRRNFMYMDLNFSLNWCCFFLFLDFLSFICLLRMRCLIWFDFSRRYLFCFGCIWWIYHSIRSILYSYYLPNATNFNATCVFGLFRMLQQIFIQCLLTRAF